MNGFREGDRLLGDEFALLIVDPGREAVESNDTTDVASLFQHLQVTNELMHKNQGRVTLAISGYDDDERALWEIPEVRRWFRAADPLVRYWFWFLNPHPKAAGLTLLMCSVCPYEKISPSEFRFDPAEQSRFLETNFLRLNELCRRLGCEEDDIRTISEAITAHYASRFSGR